ncbi:MBL fold metallo-hydrolase [Clostridium butyricum]
MSLYELCVIRTKNGIFVNYCYLLFDKETKEALIIDPAWDINKINNIIVKNNLKLKWILLTHSHKDHINLVNPLIKQYNADVFISESESLFYQYKCANMRIVKDNEKLFLGNIMCKCILTPGHSIGSMCFIIDDYIFTGDTLFIEGCGVCDTNGGNAESMFNSIQRLKRIIKPHVKVYPAHSFGMNLGQTMANLYNFNIYLNIEDKSRFVDFRERKTSNSYCFK